MARRFPLLVVAWCACCSNPPVRGLHNSAARSAEPRSPPLGHGSTSEPHFITAEAIKANITAEPRLLFVDRESIASLDAALSLRVQPPRKGERVLVVSEPWESLGISYAHLLRGDDLVQTHRMYYRCSERGAAAGASTSRLCLAESRDGLAWTKPRLGVYGRNGSTANNILIDMQTGGHSVFRDTKPGISGRGWHRHHALRSTLTFFYTGKYHGLMAGHRVE
jgi:hypothetical protein